MIDPQAKPKPYLRLMVLVALLGVVREGVTFAFTAWRMTDNGWTQMLVQNKQSVIIVRPDGIGKPVGL